jgi:hypothetical protein
VIVAVVLADAAVGVAMTMSEPFTVHVGWSSVRPIIPDQHWSSVDVAADNAMQAEIIAAQIVSCRPSCEMVTRLITVV